MNFSIRALLALTTIVALLLTAVLQQKKANQLEKEIRFRESQYGWLTNSRIYRRDPAHIQKQIMICEQVLPDVRTSSVFFAAAKQRFQQLQEDGGDR